MLKRLIAATCMLWMAVSAEAAEIVYEHKDGQPVTIRIKGELVQEDGVKFKLLADQMPGGTVELESTGGSAGAAVYIGNEIKRRKFATIVYANRQCVSACGFIWLAGNPRIMDQDARLGFHGVYVIEDGKAIVSGPANALMGSYLAGLGLQPAAVYFVTEAKPDGMNWLTLDTAARLGIDVFRLDKPWERKWAKRVTVTKVRPNNSKRFDELFRRSTADEVDD